MSAMRRTSLWDDAFDAAEVKAQTEGWTHSDVVAAVYQVSLVSYWSQLSYKDDLAWLGPGGQNVQYVASTPEQYLHNCP